MKKANYLYGQRMIMTKTPLRITFVGGGTDLPGYYKNYGGGAVVSAAINKYIHIVVNKKFDNRIRVSYSRTEIVDSVDKIQHPTVREALKLLKIDGGIEIVSISDIPSGGTGLGSSSTFLVGLLNALHAWKGEFVSPKELAEEAVRIERGILKEPGGKQDQYIAAYGGIKLMEFNEDESVVLKPVIAKESDYMLLKNHLMLLYTGLQRSSAQIHSKQADAIQKHVSEYNKMRDLSYALFDSICNGRWARTGKFLDQNWKLKRTLSEGISDSKIDAMYNKALATGALGGKLIGAGGGGFLLMFAPPAKHAAIKRALPQLKEEPFGFEVLGSRIVYVGE